MYLEVEPQRVSIFVRDRGRGFDPGGVAADRRGISGSIVDRLARAGGTGQVRTIPGEGTEVEMSLPRSTEAIDAHDHACSSSTTISCSSRACAPSWAPRSTWSAAASEVDAAIEMIRDRAPDVVLVDVHMPGGGGARVIAEVLATHPDMRFLALSVSDAPEDVIATIRAGARGYVTKTIAPDELVDAIAARSRPATRCSRRDSPGFVLDAFSSEAPPATDPELEQLTPREREVLRLIARGYAYKEVARDLGISVKTVETHVSSVLRKLQLSSRHQLARWATDRRLL